MTEMHELMSQPSLIHYAVCETHCFNVNGTEQEIIHDQNPVAVTCDPNTASRYESIPPRPVHTEILGADFCTIRYRVIPWGDDEYIRYLTNLAQKETAPTA